MSDTKRHAILEAHVGKEVTAVLGDGGQSSVFQGVLQKENLEVGSDLFVWVIVSPRGMFRQSGSPVVVPKTKVYFDQDQLGHLLVRQETEDEAVAILKEEAQSQEKKSSLIGPDGSVMQ